MKKVRFFSALMAVCMMLSLIPVSALAAEAEHTPDCGYVCTHEHDEGCGYYVHSTQAEPCDHTDDCGYVAADAYGVCDCAAEADEEGNVVHAEACASLTVVTAAAPCAHADGHETDVTSEDADACTHACGDDEWVCAGECPVVASNEAVALMSSEVIRNQVQVVLRDKDRNYAFNNYVDLQYDANDPKGLQMAIEGDARFAAAMRTLVESNSAYYISKVSDYTKYIYVDTALAGDITVTATNSTVSYKTTAMSAAVPYTNPVPNGMGLTFYFTPAEGFELESAKLFQKDIELTEENDGSYSYTIGDNDLYYTLTLTVTFIEKPAEVEALTLDMKNGSVSVEKSGENLLVNQSGTRYTLTGGALTLTGTMDWGNQMPKSDVVAIGKGVALDLITDHLTIKGNWTRKHIITIGEDAVINWNLQGETTLFGPTASAVKLASGAAVTIKGEKLTATNDGQDYAAVSVPQGAVLTIDGATVTAKGGGAGIGSDTNHNTSSSSVEGKRNETWAGEINIVSGAHVTAKGGTGAAAIGGGEYSNSGSIRIGAGCTVNATAGGNGAAAIGGGEQAAYSAREIRGGGMAGTIVIEAGATVVAGSGAGSAIGRGLCSDGSIISDTSGSITIEKGADITAYSLGHDNYTGEHGKAYYFAIDAGIANCGEAPILNARFDKDALPRKRVIDKTDPQNPVSVPQFNNIIVMGGEKDMAIALPAESPISAFATTVSGAGDYMVANAADGKTAERAQYLLEGEDSQYLFTVNEGITTRDQLKFTSFTITATAGDNGSISDAGEGAVSPLADKTYTLTPADGYVVDALTVDGQAVEVTGNTYTFENVTAHHTIAVSFKTAPVTPPVDPGTPGVTTYTITVKYVKLNGEALADSYTTHKNSEATYDVSAQAAKAIEGYTIDHVDGAVKGTLRGDVTVTVYYKQNGTDTPDVPETDIPEEEPPLTDLPEVEIPGEDTPLTPLPEEEGDVVIVDPETPLGSLPQTGTGRSVDPAVTLGLLALTGSLAMAGLTVGMKKRKDGEAAE